MAGVAAVWRVWTSVPVGVAVVVLTLGSEALAVAQDDADKMAEAQSLQHEIWLLQQCKRIGLTGEQRLAMAQIIAVYRAEQQAATEPGDLDALVNALWAARAALLANEEPTPEMWQAVQAARGQGPDREAQLAPLRQKAQTDLIAVLTEEQRVGLVVPPAGELAQNMLGQLARIRQLPEDQRAQAAQQAMAQISQQVAQAVGGAQVEHVQGIFRGLLDRFPDATPQEVWQQREQLVGELGQQLQPLLTTTQQQIQDRLMGRMHEWLENEVVLLVLMESAEAMGASQEQ